VDVVAANDPIATFGIGSEYAKDIITIRAVIS